MDSDRRGVDTAPTRERHPVGVLVPSSNTVVEPDFHAMAPLGVTIHGARLYGTETTLSGLGRLAADIETASKALASAEVELIAYACTTGSLFEGADSDRQLAARITRISGIPAVTTSTAILEAFVELGVRRVAVGTPYIEEVNVRVAQFFADNGITVSRLVGLKIQRNVEIGRTHPSRAVELGREVDTPEAEAILLTCTDLRSAEIAEDLEQELVKPVITSNQATMWAILRRLRWTQPIAGYGLLLRRLQPARSCTTHLRRGRY